MNIKLNINKYFLLIFIFSFFSSILLFSQGIDNWSVIKNFKNFSVLREKRIEQFGSYIFLPNSYGDKFLIIDFYGNEQVFSNSSGHFPAGPLNPLRPGFSLGEFVYYPNILGCNGGLVEFSNIGTKPECKYIYFKNEFGVPDPPYESMLFNLNVHAVNICNFDNQDAFCYLFEGQDESNPSSLRFVKVSKPDSIIAEFVFPKYNPDADTNNGFVISRMGNIYVDDSLIFLTAKLPKYTFIKFNTNTKEFTRCYCPDFIVYDPLPDISSREVKYEFMYPYYFNTKGSYLSNKMHNFWVVKVTEEGLYIYDESYRIKKSNFLLTYIPDIGFKSIPIIPKNLKYYKEGKDFNIIRFGILGNDSTLYFVYRTDQDNQKSVLYKTEIVIYNIFTDEYKSICIPPELIVWDEDDDPYLYGPYPRPGTLIDEIVAVKELINPNNEKILAILLYTGHLLFYNKTSAISDTYEGIKDFDISKIYPNPTSEVSTAEIMCYVQDISNLDIGLYNLFGHKILDLNNNYSYNSLTYTISTTFNIPKGIPKGTYYLNVSNGIERRTQAIVIK